MKRMKKLVSVILAIALIGASLCGCVTKKDEANKEATLSTPATDVSGEPQDGGNWEGETSHIIVTYLTLGTEPKDLKEIEAAVNEITVPKIGVEIEFKTLSVFEALSQYSMWIAIGEPMDVAIVAFTDISSYANQGMLLPLEEFIVKNAQHIKELESEFPIYDAAVFEGSDYGIRVIPPTGVGESGGFTFRKTALDSAGLSYVNNTKITLDELGDIFSKIKKANPDTYPCGVFGLVPAFGYTEIIDLLGATASSGVLIGTDSTKVVNMYESEEYYSYLKYVRDWYLKGYIMKDAATSEVSINELLDSGVLSGNFVSGRPEDFVSTTKGTDKEEVHLELTDIYVKSTSAPSNTYFTLPVTCKDPDASMKFINMLYENAELANLITWGKEDKHYKIVNPEYKVIDFPEGVDKTNSPYYGGLPLWGDQRMMYMMNGAVDPKSVEERSKKGLANQTKGVGFCYDPSAMTSKIIAVDAVVNEYRAALETGSADLDSNYQEFIAKLKANGIDEIIADKQAQFDAWLAQQ